MEKLPLYMVLNAVADSWNMPENRAWSWNPWGHCYRGQIAGKDAILKKSEFSL